MCTDKKPNYVSAGAPVAAIDALARRLYETMDKIDPSPSAEWPNLDCENREFYRECVRDLLAERRLIQEALASPATTK
jgi:hypothetical protein